MISFIFAAEGWEPFTSGPFFNAWKKPNVDYPDQNLYIYKGKMLLKVQLIVNDVKQL